jgi:translation initiation factor IF-2
VEVIGVKMRVYELAEDLKIPTKELIWFLNKEGIKIKNHMSTLDKDTIELIKEGGQKINHHSRF